MGFLLDGSADRESSASLLEDQSRVLITFFASPLCRRDDVLHC